MREASIVYEMTLGDKRFIMYDSGACKIEHTWFSGEVKQVILDAEEAIVMTQFLNASVAREQAKARSTR